APVNPQLTVRFLPPAGSVVNSFWISPPGPKSQRKKSPMIPSRTWLQEWLVTPPTIVVGWGAVQPRFGFASCQIAAPSDALPQIATWPAVWWIEVRADSVRCTPGAVGSHIGRVVRWIRRLSRVGLLGVPKNARLLPRVNSSAVLP